LYLNTAENARLLPLFSIKPFLRYPFQAEKPNSYFQLSYNHHNPSPIMPEDLSKKEVTIPVEDPNKVRLPALSDG